MRVSVNILLVSDRTSLKCGIALKIEWLKSRRRVLGWSEECELLSAEMRRSLRFLQHKAKVWDQRQDSRQTTSESLNEGLRAYAHRQSELQTQLAISFAKNYDDALKRSETSSSTIRDSGETSDVDDEDDEEDDDVMDFVDT